MHRTASCARWIALAAAGCALGLAAPPTSRPAPPPTGRVEFAPGVTIDWHRMQVELAGTVVLREGLLELFACTPHTREHESIVAVRARPLHVFQALGLIGLGPGRPVTYDPDTDRWLPAAGDSLVIEVRFADQGQRRTVNVWEWMKDAETDKPCRPRDWVFAGSKLLRGDVFGADADGTVICVVDFDTALVALPRSHSADNALLWVAARTAVIPPKGTPCTLLIRSVEGDALRVECDARGRFRIERKWLDLSELAEVLRARLARSPTLKVKVAPLAGVSPEAGRRAVQAVRDMGVADVRLAGPGPGPQPASEPARPPPPAGPAG